MSSALDGIATRRLWSFWDMFKLDADKFVAAIDGMATLGQCLHDYQVQAMKEVKINTYTVLQSDRDLAESLLTQLRLLELPAAKAAQRLIDTMKIEDASIDTLNKQIRDVHQRMKDEMESIIFLAILDKNREGYEQKDPLFGKTVETKFPSLIYDIEEAGKCYALDRSTASAFHSIRTLEAGIRAMARSLGIPDPTRGPDRNWGNVLRDIKAEIDKRWPSNTGRMSGDAQLFDEAYGALAGMQNPYRNSTMHLAAKYTQDEAQHIFEMVKGFMKRLAVRMDEQGLPLA